MALGTDHITHVSAGTSGFIPEVWSGEVVYAAESRLVAKPLITEYSGFANGDEGFGDIIHVPSISDFVAYPKTANTQVTLNPINEAVADLLINVHDECSYLIEDRAKKLAIGKYLGFYSKKAGFAIAESFDTAVLAKYADAGGVVGDGSTKLSRVNIVLANFYLDEAKAPLSERAFIVSADAKADLLDLDEFTLYESTGTPKVLTEGGVVGEVLGIPVHMSQNVPTAAGTPNVVHNLLLHKEAIGYAMPQAPRPQAEYKLEYLGWLYVVDIIYGIKTFRPDWMVDFRSLERV